jgi:hemerythrin superfamily protein
MLFGRVRDGFVRHALWEESIIYPALRFADQAEAAADLCTRHSDMKAALFDLERTPTDDPSWLTKLTALMRDFEVQARREEEELFPALRRAITAEEDVRLTALVNQQNRRFV